MLSISRHVPKPEVVTRICEARGWSFNPYFPPSLKEFSEKLLSEDASSAALKRRYFGREETIAGSHTTVLAEPTLLNGHPQAFGAAPLPNSLTAPPYKVLRVENGLLGLVNDAATVFDQDGYIHPDYSSLYYPILPHVEDGNCLIFDDTFEVDGQAFVMMDDVGGLNFCHWLCDWLPRLAALPRVLEDTYVIMLDCKAPWQIETLRACGFTQNRIISLNAWQTVRARELIVPSNISDVIHPCQRAARWGIGFLRNNIDNLLGEANDDCRKIYFSRADARVRHVENEQAFSTFLRKYGYQTITASGMTVAAQARLFRSATSIISLHGAGLTNLVFCRPDTKILEIMPEGYGTPAFLILASGCGLKYASYIASNLAVGDNRQTDNVTIDIEHFDSVARNWLIE